MKRYYHKRKCAEWHKIEVPRLIDSREGIAWCKKHLGARFYYNGNFWFE